LGSKQGDEMKPRVFPDPYKCPICNNTSWEIKLVIPFGVIHELIIMCTKCNNLRQPFRTDKGGYYIGDCTYTEIIQEELRKGG
jgi:hypothetical protein